MMSKNSNMPTTTKKLNQDSGKHTKSKNPLISSIKEGKRPKFETINSRKTQHKQNPRRIYIKIDTWKRGTQKSNEEQRENWKEKSKSPKSN